MLLAIAAPPDNDRGPRYMQEALASIHQSLPRGRELRLIYTSCGDQVMLCVEVEPDLREVVAEAIAARYPNCKLQELDREAGEWGTPPVVHTATLRLVPDLFPILRHAQFEDILQRNFADPIAGILRCVRPESVQVRVTIAIRPAGRRLRRRARAAVRRLDRPFFRRHLRLAAFYARTITRPWTWPLAWMLGLLASRSPGGGGTQQLDTSAGRYHEREGDLQAASDKLGGHLFATTIRLDVCGPAGSAVIADDRLRALSGAFGAFTVSRLATFRLVRGGRRRGPGFLASHEELASLFHPPAASVLAERLHTSAFRELEPPPVAADGERRRGSDARARPFPGRRAAVRHCPRGSAAASVHRRQDRHGQDDPALQPAAGRHRGGPGRDAHRSARGPGRCRAAVGAQRADERCGRLRSGRCGVRHRLQPAGVHAIRRGGTWWPTTCCRRSARSTI